MSKHPVSKVFLGDNCVFAFKKEKLKKSKSQTEMQKTLDFCDKN